MNYNVPAAPLYEVSAIDKESGNSSFSPFAESFGGQERKHNGWIINNLE